MVAVRSGERGQAAVEYVGVILLLSAALAGALALTDAGVRPAGLGEAVAEGMLCAIRLGSCDREEPEARFDPEIAARLRDLAPQVRFEDAEFVSLPVDPRRCRERACADSSARGRLVGSHRGERPTAFVHAIDCRAEPAEPPPEGTDCGGARAGNLYLHYWLYYPESWTRPFGRAGGFHRDDWESLQLRVRPGGEIEARASSHHGHQYGPDPISDIDPDRRGLEGARRASRWGPYRGYVWVSSGSHAGRADGGEKFFRAVPARRLQLSAVEAGIEGLDAIGYEITPPWRKRVWSDPEHDGT